MSILKGIGIFLLVCIIINLIVYILKYINIKTGKGVQWATGNEVANRVALQNTSNQNSIIKFKSLFYANSEDMIDQKIKEKLFNDFGFNFSDYTFISAIWAKNILFSRDAYFLYITKEIIFTRDKQILTKNITSIQSGYNSISVNTGNNEINLFGGQEELIAVIKRDITKAIT